MADEFTHFHSRNLSRNTALEHYPNQSGLTHAPYMLISQMSGNESRLQQFIKTLR